MLNDEYREAISEVLDILENSEDDIKNKIPKKLMKFFEENKSDSYVPNLDHTKPLDEMELKEKTKDIIAVIYNYVL